MALPLKVDKLEDVPESVRDQYVEKDGVFVLDIEGTVYLDEDVTGLKTALDKERKARREADKKAKFVLSDEERDEFERLRKEEKDLENKTLESKGEYDKLIEKMKTDHETESAAKDVALEEEKSRTRRLYLRDKVRGAAVASGVIKDNVEDVVRLTEDRFELREDEIVVLDDEGELSADNVKSFFEKTFKQSRPIYYEPSSDRGGTGTKQTNQRTGKGGNIVLAYEDAKNPQVYRKAQADAAERGVVIEIEGAPYEAGAQPTGG